MTTATKERRKARTTGISLPIATLRSAMATVRAAVANRSPKPILLSVLLANGGITASDLELQVSAEVPYTDAPILLPFGRLRAILDHASGDEVTLTHTGTRCSVEVGVGRWDLPTEDALEFPRWEPTGLKRICTIPADQFVRAVEAVAYATDNKSSRFALGAILLEVERAKGVVHFVATDGRRLSECKVELSNNEDPDDSTTLVPERAIDAIREIANGSNGAVKLEASANELVATIGGTVVTARLVDGRFPKWRDFIPEDRHAKASLVNGAELLAATRQAAIVTSEQSKGVTFAFVENGIHLTAQSAEAGQSSVTCGLLEAGLTASVALDPGFVAEFLRGVDEAEPVEVEAVDAQSAVVLRCGDCTGVIMPLAKD
jgi:DNA polymerase-3 subunit beta